MPNGGSDCCGTCWFNPASIGRSPGDRTHRGKTHYCNIRDIAIEDPFYTYCANHPHRRPDRDPIPIGPVMRAHDGMTRSVWIPAPDSQEARGHLLDLLADFLGHRLKKDRYPAGLSLMQVVIWQLGEFREVRAVSGLERIRDNSPDFLADMARVSLAKIRGENSNGQLNPPSG